MIEGFFYGCWIVIKYALIGLWKMFKWLTIFFTEHSRYLFLLIVVLVTIFYTNIVLLGQEKLEIDKEDLTIAEQMTDRKVPLVGSMIDPGSFGLGPAYHVIIAPVLWLNDYEPEAMGNFGLYVNVATVILLFIAGKRFFSYQAGIFAGGLYAVSALVFSYAYGSWRLDILPFFVLLYMHTIFNASASARPILTNLAAGILLGICLQLHYAALFLGLFTLAYCIGTNIILYKKQFFKPALKQFFTLGIGLLLVSAPFIYSEATNNFAQTQALAQFLLSNISGAEPLAFYQHYARLVAHYPALISTEEAARSQSLALGVFAMVLAVASFAVLATVRNSFIKLLNILWIVLGVVYMSLFSKTIIDYHFSPLYPVFFLLIGNVLGTIYHLANQERTKLAKQLISQNGDTETYTMIPVDVTDNKKLALHYMCVTISVLLFLLIFSVNIAPVVLSVLLQK